MTRGVVNEKQKVLLVGEEIGDDTTVRATLEQSGYEVFSASSANQGRGRVRDLTPEILLVEVERELDDAGLALIREVSGTRPNSATLCVTRSESFEVAVAALRAGATDYLTLPIEREQLLASVWRLREREARWSALARTTILVLEDHEPTRKRLVSVLEKEGYLLLAASDGQKGLEVLDSRWVDVVVADVRMPEKDGLTVLREIKARELDVEVILVTAFGDHELVVNALRDGVTNFLRKPVDIDDLLSAITHAIDCQTARRSWACHERGMALLRELRPQAATQKDGSALELAQESSRYFRQRIFSLPFEVVVVRSDRSIVAGNFEAAERAVASGTMLGPEWLALLGLVVPDAAGLAGDIDAVLADPSPGTKTVQLDQQACLLVAPLQPKEVGDGVRLFAVALRRA